nr:type II CRISPR-associated endonuclease Cas1 [Acidaminococcus fermentans]
MSERKYRNRKRYWKKRGKEEASLLQSYMEQLQPGDATNREGHAAKVYFNAMFGTDFVRSEDNSINAALNYGYSILLSCFTREITANGYLTQLGLFHENMFNPFNLASDLMEPYRPLVDDLVYAVQPEKFSTEEKHQMLSLLGTEVEINQRREVLGNSIKIYAKGVFDALENDDIHYMRFYKAGA